MNMLKKVLFTIICFSVFANAKNLPVEDSFITGTLENGFKYTIKKNDKPSEMASMRLLVKVGALEEDDDQKGVAHLVEHMAFNGTKHFPGNDVIKFLESIGVNFGSHLNASTGTTRTVYQLQVPLKNDNLEKSMLIFQDWAGAINFTQKELDKERGVIQEEARSGKNMRFRLFNQAKDVYFANSAYVNRTPIGDMDIIQNISLQRVKDFYDTWYRPELMHFSIAGDFDEKEIEKLIINTFKDLKNNSNKTLTNREVPRVDETRIFVVKDEELTKPSVSLSFYDELYLTKKESDYKKDLTYQIMTTLFNLKGSEQAIKNNPAARSISLRQGTLGTNTLSFNFGASFTGNNELKAFEELTSLIYSIEKFGFEESDFKRTIKNMKSSNEQKLKNLVNKTSSSYADEIVGLDERDEIFIDEEFKIALEKKLLDEITLEDVNSLYRKTLSSKSRIIAYQLPQNQDVSKRRVLSILKNAKNNVKEKSTNKDLPSRIVDVEKLKPAKIIDEKYDSKYDFYEFTLENGVKVAYKFNDYSKNKVMVNAFSKGGFSLYETKDLTNAQFALKVIGQSGYDGFNILDYKNIYADKQIKFQSSLNRYNETLSGSTSSTDFEYLLETFYLFTTKYQFDENIFANTKYITLANLKKEDRVPVNKFRKEFAEFKYNGHERFKSLTKEDVETLNKEKMLEIYKDRFKDLNNFMFVIVGDIKKDEVKKNIAKYLGNLPTYNREETYNYRGVKPVSGKQEFIRFYNNENISDVSLSYTSELPYSYEESIKLSALADVLNKKLREFIREEKSGVYGINVRSSFSRIPYNEAAISISFSCDPARKDELVSYVNATIEDIKKDLVEQKYVDAFIKKKVFGLKKAKEMPRFWASQIKSHYYYGDSLSRIDAYEGLLKSISPIIIKESANKYLDTMNVLYTELNPKSLKSQE